MLFHLIIGYVKRPFEVARLKFRPGSNINYDRSFGDLGCFRGNSA